MMRERADSDEGDRSGEKLPNGYTRGDYYEFGYSDSDIARWGLDQPGAPDPMSGGYFFLRSLQDDLYTSSKSNE